MPYAKKISAKSKFIPKSPPTGTRGSSQPKSAGASRGRGGSTNARPTAPKRAGKVYTKIQKREAQQRNVGNTTGSQQAPGSSGPMSPPRTNPVKAPGSAGNGILGFLDIFDFFSKNNFPGSKK
jgi:hypothetical protein